MITVNQQFKDLITIIKLGLTAQAITGWEVYQANQQSIGNIPKPYILIHRITTSPVGWQQKVDTYNSLTQKIEHTEVQIEEVVFQMDAVMDRKTTDTVTTKTGVDVLSALRRYFLSDIGIGNFLTKGYHIFRPIGVVPEDYYTNVNEVYQVHPHFDLHLLVWQSDLTLLEKIKGFKLDLKEI